MPVYAILCPDCGRASKTLVLEGCKTPIEWVCGGCGGRRAEAFATQERHPWENPHASGCLCCGETPTGAFACSKVE